MCFADLEGNWREGNYGRGVKRAAYGEEWKGVHSLAGDDGYELHFAEEGDFGRCEAWREGEGHCEYELIEPRMAW
jgi:hypothetical protein